MKVVAIVQARLNSTRLPRKVFLDLAGAPMLARHVDRLARARLVDEVIVATTTNESDSAIVAFCTQRGYRCFAGSEEDVLDRYYRAAETAQADVIVRTTSDCPFTDPDLVDRTVGAFLDAQPPVDYANTNLPPRTFPRGLGSEVFRFDTLQQIWQDTAPGHAGADHSAREHVTLFIYSHPERFRLLPITNDRDLSSFRLTVDEMADYELARRIYEHFGHDRFTWKETVDLLLSNPDWQRLNQDVVQKEA